MANILNQVGDLYKLQKEARQMQKEMKKISISGYSKNEDVEIVMDGTQEVQEIGIDDSLMSIENKSKLEKAIIEAFKDAQKKLQKEMAKDMDLDKIRGMLGS